MLSRQADSQTVQRRLQAFGKILGVALQASRVAFVETRHGGEQKRRVGGARAHGAALIQARRESDHAVAGDAAVGGLDPGDSRERSRLADGAAGIGAGGERNQPRRHRRRGAARGSAGHAVQSPGVAHRTVIAVLVGRAHGELVHVGLAHHDQSVIAAAFDNRGVIR